MNIVLAQLLNNLTTMLSLSLFDFLPVLILTESLKETVKVPIGLE